MNRPELENPVRVRQLKPEPGTQSEIDGLMRSGEALLRDAANSTLSPESRFDLAYNAAHALALAALRWHGYRSEKRAGASTRSTAMNATASRRPWPSPDAFARVRFQAWVQDLPAT